jgi:hypothetical protein
MKKIIKLTENDLINLVKKVIKEQGTKMPSPDLVIGGVTYKNKNLTTKGKVEAFLEYSFPNDLMLTSNYLKHIKQTDVDSMLNFVAKTGSTFNNSNGYQNLISYFKDIKGPLETFNNKLSQFVKKQYLKAKNVS